MAMTICLRTGRRGQETRGEERLSSSFQTIGSMPRHAAPCRPVPCNAVGRPPRGSRIMFERGDCCPDYENAITGLGLELRRILTSSCMRAGRPAVCERMTTSSERGNRPEQMKHRDLLACQCQPPISTSSVLVEDRPESRTTSAPRLTADCFFFFFLFLLDYFSASPPHARMTRGFDAGRPYRESTFSRTGDDIPLPTPES